jgi:type I restriction-modification system DNA methylase subunit
LKELAQDEVLFIDLRQWGEPFEKKYTQFSSEQIQQIAENLHNWQRVETSQCGVSTVSRNA